MPQNLNMSKPPSRALLAAIVESSDDAIISKDLNGYVTSWNKAAQQCFGYTAEEMIGRNISVLIPPGCEAEEPFILARIRAGERVEHYETVRRRKDGSLVAISLTVSPIRDADGTIVGASKIARDISERKRLEETQRTLHREVNHRSRNLLAVVEAIARQTARHSGPDEFSRSFSERLRALSANQDLLLEGGWRGIDIASVARSQLGALHDLVQARVNIEGERFVLTPAASQAVGLALHELATNAVKFGALSAPHGQVVLSWRLVATPVPTMLITWRETGGPTVAPPVRLGFGTTILNRITSQALNGKVRFTYAPDGLAWELRAPAKLILAAEDAPLQTFVVRQNRHAAS